MPIARNKKVTADPDAIAAFGAAADALPSESPKSAEPKSPTNAPTPPAGDAPLTALVRWRGHEELRDRISDYNKATRYPNHAIMLRAMEIGMEHIEKHGME
jgi:hypothetical protein